MEPSPGASASTLPQRPPRWLKSLYGRRWGVAVVDDENSTAIPKFIVVAVDPKQRLCKLGFIFIRSPSTTTTT